MNREALERVEAAVRSKHSEDVIVPECKDGPTHGSRHLRLDYWVLRRSWTNFAMIGYEVKASRADFLRDNKWNEYLPLCNELSFIQTERGIVQPEELPAAVGLYRLAGPRLAVVRKPVWREIEPPLSLLAYVIMCRARIEREHGETREGRIAWWETWLAERDESKTLGHKCSKGLRERFDALTQGVKIENNRLRAEHEQVADAIALLDANGVPWRTSKWRLESEIKATTWDRQRVVDARDGLNKLLGEKEVEP